MIIGCKLYRTETTDDSMAWARQHIAQAPDGSIFLADNYTKARGRQGRNWTVRSGQLMVTMLLKPALLKLIAEEDIQIRLNQLNMALCSGIAQALKAYSVKLKWPNDFVLNGKKLGGMILQLVWENNQPVALIVGFGLNINNECSNDDDLKNIAISLKDFVGADLPTREIYKNILAQMDRWYSLWGQMNFTMIYKTWKLMLSSLGHEIIIHKADGTSIVGKAIQVLPNGDIMLEVNGKKAEIISYFQVEEITETKS